MTFPTIRALTRDDLSTARDLITAVDLFPAVLLAEMAEPFLSGQSEELWLIAGDGTGLAYAAPERMTDGTWNLLLLAVHPNAQRQGLARALVHQVEAHLRTQCARLLLVETSDSPAFAGTRQVYPRLGFAQVARIADYYQAGEAKVVFARPLSR
jgi:ribosomal protein S18 acetylase RimI-like enzyme